MAKCSAVARYNHKVPSSLYLAMSRKALKKIFQMKGDAVKILTVLSAKLAWLRARERHDSTASCPPELNTTVDLLREQKSTTLPRSGNSRKLAFRQRKLSLTVEQERGFIKDYSNPSLPEGKKQKGPKVKTYFEVDFEDSTCEEDIDIEELKRILTSFSSKDESSIEGDGFLTTTLCSTEL